MVDEAVEVLNAAKQELDFTKTGEDAEALRAALQEAAAAYKALHIKARSAGVAVPKDAAILADEEVVWAKEDLIGARDWMRFENAGWVVMEELPEVPEVFDRTYFLAQDQGDPPDAIVPVSAPPAALPGCARLVHAAIREDSAPRFCRVGPGWLHAGRRRNSPAFSLLVEVSHHAWRARVCVCVCVPLCEPDVASAGFGGARRGCTIVCRPFRGIVSWPRAA